jgi:hypothetical protein
VDAGFTGIKKRGQPSAKQGDWRYIYRKAKMPPIEILRRRIVDHYEN